MRASELGAFALTLAACGFDHGVAPGSGDGGTGSDGTTMIDAATTTSQIKVGTPGVGNIYYNNGGQVSYTVAPNASLLLVGLSTSYAGTLASSVRWGNADLTSVGFVDAGSSDGRVEIWKLLAPQPGTDTIDVRVDDSSSAVVIGVLSFSGTHATAPLGIFNSSQATAGSPTISLPSASTDLVFAVAMWNGNYTTLASDPAQASHWNEGVSAVIGAGATKPGGGTTTMRWTVDGNYNDYWAIGAVALKPSVQ